MTNVIHPVKNPAAPGSPEWSRLVTASKVPAIVGESHWQSRYGIWCGMNGLTVPPEHGMVDRFRTGHAMELALAYWWGDRHPEWGLSRGEVQLHNPDLDLPTVATLDRVATLGHYRRSPKHSRNIQFKTVGDYEEWSNLTAETLPPEWLIQVTWEMLVSGLTEHPAVLVAGGPYFDWQEFEVPFDQALADQLVTVVREFIATLDDEPPEPTAPRDVKIAKLRHPDVDPEAEPVLLTPALAREWVEVKSEEKELKARLRELGKTVDVTTARLLEVMRKAPEAITPDGYVVAKRKARKDGVVVTRFTAPKPKEVAA